MKHEVTSREVHLRLDECPPLLGTTSSLNERTVVPMRAVIHVQPNGVYAEVSGPTFRDGVVGAAHFAVKVAVSGEAHVHYEQAPDWMRELVEEVTR